MIMDKILDLMITEMAVKKKECEELLISEENNEYRNKFIDRVLLFFLDDDLYDMLLNLDNYCNIENINDIILMIDYIQTLPFKVPQKFIRKMLQFPMAEIKIKYPNFYTCCDFEYLEEIKSKLLQKKLIK